MDALTWNFTVAVPDRWYVRDEDPRERETSATRAVDARLSGRPDLAPVAPVLRRLLMDSWQDAELQGALAAATLWEPSDDGSGATAATLVVLAAHRREPEDDDAEIAGLLEILGADSEIDLAPRQVGAVELPVGRAVRLRRLTRTDCAEPGEGELVVDTVQHWVLVGGGPAILVLVGSTPCLDMADELAATFDAIAETLTFQRHP
jgi:hypothetical protein